MATINGSTTHSNWDFKLEVTEGAVNVANNTSPLTVKAYLGRNGVASYIHGAKITITVSVTGCSNKTISYSNSARVDIAVGSWLNLGSTTFTVPHDADGSKKVTVSASFTNSVSPTRGSASGSVTLTTIARASQPSCITWPEHTQNVGNFGATISIHMNRKSDSFTHTVRYAFGSLSGTIATGVTTGTTWTIPLSFMDKIPNATSGSGTIYVDTYNGSTKVGTKYCGFTATVPSSVKPTAKLQVLDATSYQGKYGNLVKGLSKLKVTVTGTPSYSSPIQSYRVTANGKTYTSASVTTDELTSSGTTTVTATVTDKRGRTSAAASASFTVLNYVAPSITALSVHRCNSDGTENDGGEYVKVTFSASITALNNKNSAAYVLRYKSSAATSYTEVPLSALAGKYAVSNYSYVFAASSNYSYTIQVQATDDIGSSVRSTSASTAFTLMNWHPEGKGIRFGGVAETANAFQCSLPSIFDSTMMLKGYRYAFLSSGTQGTTGYICMAQIVIKDVHADSPLTFVFTRRVAATPMTVHVLFSSNGTSADPTLNKITYEGTNYGAFLVKTATSTWALYVQKATAYDSVSLQDWHVSHNTGYKLSVTFPGTQISELPDPYYRATPVTHQSLVDFIYPVGSVYISYSHTSPAELFGGTWSRISNAFLWAVDSSGAIGLTGGEKTHTLTVNEMPSHTHDVPVASTTTGSTAASNYIRFNNNATSFIGSIASNATGGGAAHNNMPPYIQVSVWRRTA